MTPIYIPTSVGDLFALVHPAKVDGIDSNEASQHWVLMLPPLGEELNKCRKMLADQARCWAQQGVSVLMPDYGGTGDSAGSLADMSWSMWRQQMLETLQWLNTKGCVDVTLWGVRVGALMAADLSRELKLKSSVANYPSLRSLLLWQPVASGKLWLTQFLRLRVAAQMMDQSSSALLTEGPSSARETVASLRKKLNDGELVEIAGYGLSASLTQSLDELELRALLLDGGAPHVDWLEVSSALEPTLTPVSNQVVTQLKSEGLSINGLCVHGESFWSTQEICLVPALLEIGETLIQSATSNELETQKSPDISPPVVDSPLFMPEGSDRCADHKTLLKSVVFSCHQEEMIGVLHCPSKTDQQKQASTGVVIVVGGPQYRVGSHRQFFQLAESLAQDGIPVLRFDCRGMGDSSGNFNGFDHLNDDIRSAVEALKLHRSSVKDVVLWGLCDGASAAAFYAASDESIAGLVLLNPWVRSEEGEAKAYLKHYYLQRLFSRQLWRKVLSGDFAWRASMQSLRASLVRGLGLPASFAAMDEQSVVAGQVRAGIESQDSPEGAPINATVNATVNGPEPIPANTPQDLVAKMGQNLLRFKGKALVILSGNDLTAAEYSDALAQNNALAKASKQTSYESRRLEEADHTFSRTLWKQQVAEWTLAWIKTL